MESEWTAVHRDAPVLRRHLGTDPLPADAGAPLGGPVLKDKPTVLATVRGGGYAPGTPREGWDHSTPYLKRILAADPHTKALAAARDAGRETVAK